MNPRARGPGNSNNNNHPLKSRNSLRNNRAQQLEIIWDASEHTTNNKHENASRNNISYDPKDLFKQDTGKNNNNLHDSILSGGTRAFSNVHNKGMHDSILTGVSFMDEEGEDEEEELVPNDTHTKVDHDEADNKDDELKSSSGHSLSRFLKNTIKKGEKRDRRFSTKKIQWKRSELKKETSPVIPRRVASMKREHVVDVLDGENDADSGGDNVPSIDEEVDISVQNINIQTEIPLNLTDSDIQAHDTDAVENENAGKNGMDTSNNDNTIKTPLPQAPPTNPPPISTRRTSDFHPPSPPPRHRKYFPRTRGIMPTLVNSKREIFISGGSSRLQLSSLTLDTALPSSDAGSVLREVTNSTLTDKCNERGKYTGTVNENDEPDGYGTMTYNNGAFYKGDWKDGHWHGNGILRSPNGDSYEGDFVYDCRHGRGIYKYENGDVYEGDFSSDKRHGKGTFLFQNGAMYRGDLAFGNFEGYGWYVWDEGHYEGEWLQGAYHGIGTLQYKDGSSYTGRFKAGIADGLGEERRSDGSSRRGVWKEGELQSEEQEVEM